MVLTKRQIHWWLHIAPLSSAKTICCYVKCPIKLFFFCHWSQLSNVSLHLSLFHNYSGIPEEPSPSLREVARQQGQPLLAWKHARSCKCQRTHWNIPLSCDSDGSQHRLHSNTIGTFSMIIPSQKHSANSNIETSSGKNIGIIKLSY